MGLMHIDEKPVAITVGRNIWIPENESTASVIERFKIRLRSDNLRYRKHEKLNRPVEGVPRKIKAYRKEGDDFVIPKASLSLVGYLFGEEKIPFKLEFEEPAYSNVSYAFCGKLFEHQRAALSETESQSFGRIIGPPGCGKKVLALYKIYQKQLPALIIVSSKARALEYRGAATSFLSLNCEEIGLIGDGHNRIGTKLTIAIENSLYAHIEAIRDKMGFVVVDQPHLMNLKIFFKAINALNPRYILGLDREPGRLDRMGNVMNAFIGPIIHHIEVFGRRGYAAGYGSALKIRPTGFQFTSKANGGEMMEQLYENAKRNELIIQDILCEAADPRAHILVVSKSIEHLKVLQRLMIKANQSSVGFLTEETSEKESHILLDKIEHNRCQVLLTTLKCVEKHNIEGYDVLIVGGPCDGDYLLVNARHSLKARSIFCNGPIIYDYADEDNFLKKLLIKRCMVYRRGDFFETIVSADIVH